MKQQFDGPRLRVYLDRIVENYQLLATHYTGDETAAVVKANAYGLGAEPVARALADAGCNTFFVATLDEAIQLRSALPNRRICVFHGPGLGEELAYLNHRITPVLCSPPQVERWEAIARENRNAQSILHIDTAMARMGLTETEWRALFDDDPERIERCQISLIMSHLACASDPEHTVNAEQLALFTRMREEFPQLPASLVNSAGVFLDPSYHFQLARPGCSLYGIRPHNDAPNPMRNVIELDAPILQLRTLDKTQTIGYGATQELGAGRQLATVALGYADGILRCLTGQLQGIVRGQKVPLVGRVTMDMLTFDVTDIPEGQLQEADRITIIGDDQPVDTIADMANTIGYEVFCRLGRRIERVYMETAA